MTPEKPHHHGNLRKALIDAGLALLADDGLNALTLRACAARAGVSHAAPAHHFDGLPGLLTAIAAHGFTRFADTMLAHRARAGDAPRARLVAICEGYLAFAAGHPALFTLMFNTPSRLAPDEEFVAAADRAYGILAETCAPFRPVTAHSQSTEIMIWSLVHGLASLLQGGRIKPEGTPPRITDILPQLELRKS